MNMYRIVSARTGLIVSTLFVCVGIASSCTVDTDDLVFQSHLGGLGGDGGDGGAMSVGCEHGAMDCDGKQVEICAGGEWYPAGEACEFVCVAGLCVGSCDPGSTRCLGNTTQQTCSAEGMWGADEECEFACVDGACGGECKPGAMGCDDAMPQRCDDQGAWVDERDTPCPTTCNDGKCDTCETPGETQCSSDTEEQTCGDELEWGSPETCEYVCFGGGCTGVCTPGSARCDSTTHRQICGANGEWGPATACGDQACVGGECVGVCAPGAKRCNNGRVQLCNGEGQWENAETCSGEKPVCVSSGSSAYCAVCQPGAKRCDYKHPEICSSNGGGWKRETDPCAFACYRGTCITAKDTGVCKVDRDAGGCNSTTEAWACVRGAPHVGNCTKGQTCEDGSCGGKSTGTGTGGRFTL